MITKNALIISVLLFGNISIVSADSINIKEAITYAIENSPVLKVYHSDIFSKQELLNAANKDFFPEFKIELAPSYNSGEPTSFFSVRQIADPEFPQRDETGSMISGQVSMVVPIYQDGAFIGGESASATEAEANYRLSKAQYRIEYINVTNKIAKAFFSILMAEKERQIYQQLFDKRNKLLGIVTKKIRARVLTKVDRLSLEHALIESKTGINRARRKYENGLLELGDLMGQNRSSRFDLESLSSDIPYVPDTFVLDKILVEKAEIDAQNVKIDIAKANLRATKAKGLPEVNFEIADRAATDFEFDGVLNFASAKVNMSYSFLDFGRNANEVDASQYAVLKEEQTLTVIIADIERELKSSRDDSLNAIDEYDVSKKKLEKVKYEENSTREKHNLGFVSLEELIEIENEVHDAEIKLLEDRYNCWSTYAELLIAIGQPYSEDAFAEF